MTALTTCQPRNPSIITAHQYIRSDTGIRADAKAAKVVKETGQNAPGYNPQGLGAAWSHNFLNQKPWHPANFRNQAKVYEAEQNAIKAQKDKALAKVWT